MERQLTDAVEILRGCAIVSRFRCSKHFALHVGREIGLRISQVPGVGGVDVIAQVQSLTDEITVAQAAGFHQLR